jgi:hypothetical protein
MLMLVKRTNISWVDERSYLSSFLLRRLAIYSRLPFRYATYSCIIGLASAKRQYVLLFAYQSASTSTPCGLTIMQSTVDHISFSRW